MEILNKFGFEPILFIAQIVNFLIIFLILKKFLYKPILKVLKERKQEIEEGIKKAEDSGKLLEETLEKEREILKRAQDEAKKIIDDAKIRHDKLINQAEEETRQKVEKMISDARLQITQDASAAEKHLSQHVSKIAKLMLEESLQGFFDSQDNTTILNKALKKLKTTKG